VNRHRLFSPYHRTIIVIYRFIIVFAYEDRRRFFQISLGSIAEVAAAIDLAHAFGLVPAPEQAALKSRLRLATVKIESLNLDL